MVAIDEQSVGLAGRVSVACGSPTFRRGTRPGCRRRVCAASWCMEFRRSLRRGLVHGVLAAVAYQTLVHGVLAEPARGTLVHGVLAALDAGGDERAPADQPGCRRGALAPRATWCAARGRHRGWWRLPASASAAPARRATTARRDACQPLRRTGRVVGMVGRRQGGRQDHRVLTGSMAGCRAPQVTPGKRTDVGTGTARGKSRARRGVRLQRRWAREPGQASSSSRAIKSGRSIEVQPWRAAAMCDARSAPVVIRARRWWVQPML